jgi:hypothetical protein
LKSNFIDRFDYLGSFFTGLGDFVHRCSQASHGVIGPVDHLIGRLHELIRLPGILRILSCHCL